MNLATVRYHGALAAAPLDLVQYDAEGVIVFNLDPDPLVMRAQITAWKDRLLAAVGEQIDFPVEHTLIDGMYTRKLFIPKDSFIVGKIHLKPCINVVVKGDISIVTETGKGRLQAGEVLASPAGLQKLGFAHEDTVFVNVFRTDKTDIAEIEAEIACESFDVFNAKQGALCQ
jgi:hypothetical protein